MTPEEFNTLFEETLTTIRSLISFKRDDYAPNENRFHNFDRVAATLGHHRISDCGISMDSLQACRGMWLKQFISLMDALDGRDITWSISRCDEVIHDLIIYLILTKGMFYREHNWQKKSLNVQHIETNYKDQAVTYCNNQYIVCRGGKEGHLINAGGYSKFEPCLLIHVTKQYHLNPSVVQYKDEAVPSTSGAGDSKPSCALPKSDTGFDEPQGLNPK